MPSSLNFDLQGRHPDWFLIQLLFCLQSMYWKKEFLFAWYSLCFCHWIPARISSSSSDISWQFLVCNFVFCFLFTLVQFLIPLQQWQKKPQSLPAGRLQPPHLQFCGSRKENFQIHSAISRSRSTTERTADLVVISGIPNKRTAIMHCLGPWICRHANRFLQSFTPISSCRCSPILMS